MLRNNWRRGILAAAAVGIAASLVGSAKAAPGDPVLNEILVNPARSDRGKEYFEIRGVPLTQLSNLHILFVNGNHPFQGKVSVAISLDGQTLGSNGLLLITADPNPYSVPPETTVMVSSALNHCGGALQDGTSTTLLVRSSLPINVGDDLDTNNDGILDLPSGAELLDAIGWSDGAWKDKVYGPVLTQPRSTPDAATRFRHDLTPLSGPAWYNGDMKQSRSANPTGLLYDATRASTNQPAGAYITPGGHNYPDTNSAPVAWDDFYTVDFGATLNIPAPGILANDDDADSDPLLAVLVSAPLHGTLIMSPSGAFTYIHDGSGNRTDSFSYRATDSSSVSNIATVHINVGPDVLSVEANPYLIIGGLETMTVRVNLDGPAPAGGALVSLTNTNAALHAPASITIPEGETFAEFTAWGDVVSMRAYGRIYATRGYANPWVSVSVRPVLPRTLEFSQNPTLGGTTVVGTAILEAPATAGGVLLTLVGGDPRITFDAPTVLVPEGETQVSFNVHTQLTNEDYKPLVEAQYGGQSAKRTLHVRANGVKSFTIDPSSVTGGTGAIGTVELHLPAPAGGRLVTFTSSHSTRARAVVSSITIPAGQTTANVNIVTFGGPAVDVSITARALTESKTAVISVTP